MRKKKTIRDVTDIFTFDFLRANYKERSLKYNPLTRRIGKFVLCP